MLVAACEKKSIQIFDPLTHQKIQSVNDAHSDCVNCVKFLDARMFATCSDDTTIALWDVRNLKKKIRTLLGHSKWVKNIEFSVKDKLLVTSGLDGSIYTWDINSYTEYNLVYQKVFHTSSLMRCRLSPDARQMVMCTTGGLLIIIHDLNLSTLAQDLHGFKPNLYRLMQMSQQMIPIAAMYDHLFDSSRKENRVEFVADFPEDNDAEVVSALQIHPQGWSALSRNISHDDRSEWTCIHDIQPLESERGVARDSCRAPPRCAPSPAPAHAPASPPRRAPPRRLPARARLRPLARTHSRSQLLDGISPASRSRAESEPEPEPGPSSAASSVPAEEQLAAPAPAPAAPPAARLVASMSSIQNDVWEASITVKQNRMLQEFYSRGQLRRNFNMQRITGINTGITPPAALRPRLTGFGFAVDPGESSMLAPSTSGHTSRDITTEDGPAPRRYADRFIRQNKERLLYYIEETNEGKGFIKELCYSADGRLVCSPFGRGMRLLALNEDCSELPHCVQDLNRPRLMVDVGQSLGIHQDLVVSSRFSPRYHMLVTGCLEGKILWYQPYSGEALY
ncbi:DDB1- and CUL4-associated factor 10 homolog isoform X1 [Manduca sexta]|uniref:DDB1- and CUL4-associated factor 10 homolog isoform X1 n=1 Tax=Manduca sexta TaxID=7130 RepID=UPI00188F0951|nr:DDB1- and CUL4-associated factor 10 homolog isoform X1 [Manduca sexta]